MNRHRITLRRARLAAASCLLWGMAAPSVPAQTQAPDIDALLARLARPAPAATAFREVHFSRLLAHPLVVGGELQYLGAGALARDVEQPYRERTEIHGEDVTVTRGGSVRHFSLEHAPDLRSLLASFSALLGGDRQLLAQQFDITATGDADHWSLALTPRAARARTHVGTIFVDGAAGEPRCITTGEPGGDTTVMLLGTLAQAPLPAAADAAALRAHCRAD